MHELDKHIIAARKVISNEVTYWISRRRSWLLFDSKKEIAMKREREICIN